MQNNNNYGVAPGTTQQVSPTNATANNAIVAAEVAKVQAQCVLAYQNPRNLAKVENKISGMCASLYLASSAEYEYTRGGTKITGATVKLMSAIAQAYGNITSGWKEISRNRDKSKVIAWAWDIESNYKYDLEFEVPLYREAHGGRTALTSDRDIYELIANFAARRVRKCLESVIPRYLVDMALEQCHATLCNSVDVKEELKKLVNYLKSYHNVELEEIEEKLGMKYEAFGHVQYITILKWCNALKDGTAKKADLFPNKEAKHETIEGVKHEQANGGSVKPKVNPAPKPTPEPQYAAPAQEEEAEPQATAKPMPSWF